MIAKLRQPKDSRKERSVVSGESKTYYFKKGDTVVIHSNVPFNFMDCTKDRIYKHEKIDHGLSHDIKEFKDNIEHPYEWIVTINALFDLKVVIDRSFISESLNLRVIYLLDKKTQC